MRRNTRKLGQNCHSALNNISKVHKDENSLPMEDVFLDDAIAYALGNWHPSARTETVLFIREWHQ